MSAQVHYFLEIDVSLPVDIVPAAAAPLIVFVALTPVDVVPVVAVAVVSAALSPTDVGVVAIIFAAPTLVDDVAFPASVVAPIVSDTPLAEVESAVVIPVVLYVPLVGITASAVVSPELHHVENQ